MAWDGVRKAEKFGAPCVQKIVYERKPWTANEIGDKFGPLPVASSKERQEFMVKYLSSKPRQPLRP